MDNITITEPKKNYWWITLISGIIYVLFGIWFFKAPLGSFRTLTIAFGIIILLGGAMEFYFSLKNKSNVIDYQSYIWGGIISSILGIVLIANPKTILVIISILISVWLIFRSALLINEALRLKRLNESSFKRPLTTALILIIVAVMLIWHPEIIGITIALWTAFAFIVLGVFRIYLGIKQKNAYKTSH